MGGSSSRPVLSKDSEAIQLEVNRYPVVIYTKPHCPYCTKAKNELEQDGVVFAEKDITKEGQATEAKVKGLMDLTHCRTVPQIFVCGKFIGGYTDLHARRKDLMNMIEQCSSDGRNVDKPASDSYKYRI